MSFGNRYTAVQEGAKYAFSGEYLIIRNITEADTMAQYTCAVTRLEMEQHNDLQGRRPSSGLMQVKLLSE